MKKKYMNQVAGRLVIVANRGGTIAEISAFLSDVEAAYIALYSFDKSSHALRSIRLREWLKYSGVPLWELGFFKHTSIEPAMIPPSARLSLERVQIESPGIWEFAASLNPLEQIRKFLNDRHERRKDKEYREEIEKERLKRDNELIQAQIVKQYIANLHYMIEIMGEAGIDDDVLQQIIWAQVGNPMSRLGVHQDTGLIGGAK